MAHRQITKYHKKIFSEIWKKLDTQQHELLNFLSFGFKFYSIQIVPNDLVEEVFQLSYFDLDVKLLLHFLKLKLVNGLNLKIRGKYMQHVITNLTSKSYFELLKQASEKNIKHLSENNCVSNHFYLMSEKECSPLSLVLYCLQFAFLCQCTFL